MACCGKKRAEARKGAEAQSRPEPIWGVAWRISAETDTVPCFQYVGKAGLTVLGPRTGKRYRFDHPGAVVAVDPRDRRALAAVSLLRQVRARTDVEK